MKPSKLFLILCGIALIPCFFSTVWYALIVLFEAFSTINKHSTPINLEAHGWLMTTFFILSVILLALMYVLITITDGNDLVEKSKEIKDKGVDRFIDKIQHYWNDSKTDN